MRIHLDPAKTRASIQDGPRPGQQTVILSDGENEVAFPVPRPGGAHEYPWLLIRSVGISLEEIAADVRAGDTMRFFPYAPTSTPVGTPWLHGPLTGPIAFPRED